MKPTHVISWLWRGTSVLLLAGSLLAGGLPGTAQAQAGLTLENVYTFPSESYPTGLAYGPKGAIWLTLGKANAVSQLNLPSTVQKTSLITPGALPFDIAVGESDTLWFTQQKAGKIARLDASGSLTEFALGEPGGYPSQIIAGQDGGIWFTEYQGNMVGRISADGMLLQEYELPNPASRPLGIASALDGSIWFTEWGGQRIGKFGTDGSINEISLPNTSWRPTEIVLAPDGFLWFILEIGQTLVRLDPDKGEMMPYTLSTGNASFLDLAIGPDGNLWLLGTHTLARLKLPVGSSPEVETLPLSLSVYDSQGRSQIIAGPGDEMFFTNARNQDLSRVAVPGAVGRDLQVFILPHPPVMLSSGVMQIDVELDNWSSGAATGIEIEVPLAGGVHFLDAPVAGLTCAEATGVASCRLAGMAGSSRLVIPFFFTLDHIDADQDSRYFEFSVKSAELDYLPGNNRAFLTVPVQRTIDYANDFSQGADSRWSHTHVTTDGDLTYLGLFDNHDVTLTFTNLPHHDRAYLCFDLFILGPWDGDRLVDPLDADEPPEVIGPDLWANYIDDTKLWVTSFSNDPRLTQSFPGEYNKGVFPAQSNAAAVGRFGGESTVTDSRYHFCSEQVHTGPELKYTFYGANLDVPTGEQWALDNVTVSLYYHDAFNWLYLPRISR